MKKLPHKKVKKNFQIYMVMIGGCWELRVQTLTTTIFCWIFCYLRGHFITCRTLLRLPCCKKVNFISIFSVNSLTGHFPTTDQMLSLEEANCQFEMMLMFFICFPSLIDCEIEDLKNVTEVFFKKLSRILERGSGGLLWNRQQKEWSVEKYRVC